MANHMSEVAKMLGVELGEEFMCSNGYEYILKDNGIIESRYSNDARFCESIFSATLNDLLNGKLTIKRKPWKPKDDENYWYIDENGEAWSGEAWRNRFDDCEYASDHMNYYKLGNCYRTREEAEANRDKWVAFYASDEVLEV